MDVSLKLHEAASYVLAQKRISHCHCPRSHKYDRGAKFPEEGQRWDHIHTSMKGGAKFPEGDLRLDHVHTSTIRGVKFPEGGQRWDHIILGKLEGGCHIS